MKVAIVGAGLAGLAVGYFLEDCDVTLFDPKGPGGGASGVSTGLLHPFPGKRGLRSWRASEGLSATWNLIDRVGGTVAERSGILRLGLQIDDPDAVPWDAAQVHARFPRATPQCGTWIPGGGTVYTKRYLEGLFRLCRTKGVCFEQQAIRSTEELAAFDRIVLATGYETTRFAECADLELEPTKGHTLLCRWPAGELPCGLIGSGHITPTEDPTLCQIGSTYEHNFTDLRPDPRAIEELKRKAAQFYPPAADFELVELRAGARTSRPKGYRPIAERRSEKVWVFTGLGSRGLLYHALLGEHIARSVGRSP